MNHRIVALVVATALGAALTGCSLLKKKGSADAGAASVDPPEDIGSAPQVQAGGTGAKNEADVLRYAKETKIDNEPGTIGKDGTKVRTFPQTGQDVATLAKGTAVTKIARYFSTGILVTFDDPAGGGKLLGWVPVESLDVPAAPSATATTLPTVATNAPAPKVDAGVSTKDAGVAAVDAGTKPPAGGSMPLFVPPGPGNVCPAGYALVGNGCRKPCSADGECPRGTFCVPNAGRKVCSTSH